MIKKVLLLVASILALMFSSFSNAQAPAGYRLIEGLFYFNGSSVGTVKFYVDDPSNPTKGIVTVNTHANGLGCWTKNKEVVVKKNETGMTFEVETHGRCRMTTLNLVGPTENGSYSGTIQGNAGTSILELKIK